MIDDFEKILKGRFTPIKDDQLLLDNGFMENTGMSGYTFITYRIMKPFIFDDKELAAGDNIGIDGKGSVVVRTRKF